MLRNNKIRTVINLVSKKVPNKFEDEIKYYNYDISDTPSSQIIQFVIEVLEIIDFELKQGRNILIHCYKGISRAPAIGIAFLIKHKNMYFDDAFDHVKKMIIKAEPNTGFLIQLASLSPKKQISEISA